MCTPQSCLNSFLPQIIRRYQTTTRLSTQRSKEFQLIPSSNFNSQRSLYPRRYQWRGQYGKRTREFICRRHQESIKRRRPPRLCTKLTSQVTGRSKGPITRHISRDPCTQDKLQGNTRKLSNEPRSRRIPLQSAKLYTNQ